jgi:DNA modification methylase
MGMGSQDYRPQVELILYGVRGNKSKRTWNAARRESDLWEFDPDKPVIAYPDDGNGTVIEFGTGMETVKVVCSGRVEGRVVHLDGQETDIWHEGRESSRYVHPTQKPVALIERAIVNSTKQGNLVFDPFLGSGSTLIACELHGRKCIGCELDQKFADVIRKRWAEYVHGPGCEWEDLTPIVSEN